MGQTVNGWKKISCWAKINDEMDTDSDSCGNSYERKLQKCEFFGITNYSLSAHHFVNDPVLKKINERSLNVRNVEFFCFILQRIDSLPKHKLTPGNFTSHRNAPL